MKLLILTLLVLSAAFQVHGQCQTAAGGQGDCVTIQGCKPLLELINKPNRTPQDLDTLRKSSCGFDGNNPKVCCPKQATCYTPNGAQGKCVSVYSCPHIAAMLQAPVSKENLAFVQKSTCVGKDKYSVCCGPAAEQEVEKGNCEAKVNAFPPDPRTECCGVDSGAGNKIVGGTATSVDQYPWLVLIEYQGRDNRIKLLCGGALISGKYVLTAAHCVAGAVLDVGTPKNIRLGEYDTTNAGVDCVPVEGGAEDCTEPIVVIPIERTVAHPQYNPIQKRHDIALIRMQSMAPFTDFIRPVCLPARDQTLNPPPNYKLWAAGWGAINSTHSKSTVKLHVELPFVSQRECQPSYTPANRRASLWQGQICAGGEKGKDSCKGDSGGPLMFDNNGVYEVTGVVSFGPTPCGMEDIPGVYTKVFEYNDWIRKTIAA